MATFSVETTARQDRAAKLEADAYNAQSGKEPVTVLAYVRGRITHMLNSWADRWESAERETKASLYQKASDEDKAAIDAILDSYRSA